LRLPGLAAGTDWWGAGSDMWHDALRQLDLHLER